MTEKDTDFKYVIQEISHTMIGARYTYAELLACERVPFKFQTIIDRLILPYADADMEIGAHLLCMTPEDKNYRIYEGLKLKIKYYIPKEKGGYKEMTAALSEFTKAVATLEKPPMVQEIILSNLALLGFRM